MANKFYVQGLIGLMTGAIDLDTDDLRAILIDTADYTFSQSHDNLDDVAAAARVATATITGETVSVIDTEDAILDFDDVVWTSVTGDSVEAVIIYKHTGTESTSRLLAYIDTVASGLPVTPNGGNITLQLPSGGLLRINNTA